MCFTPTYIEEGQLIQQPAYSKEPMAQRNEEAIKLLEEAGYSKANPLKFSILYNTNENHKKSGHCCGIYVESKH